MEAIKLTKKQKDKLLEMCIKLFPEYDFTLEKHRETTVTLGLKTKTLYSAHIPWFEFCITKLIHKINYPPNKINNRKLIDINDLIRNERPIIDFLYNRFKEIYK